MGASQRGIHLAKAPAGPIVIVCQAIAAQTKMVSGWSVAMWSDQIQFQSEMTLLSAITNPTQGATIFLGNAAQHWVEPSWSAAAIRQTPSPSMTLAKAPIGLIAIASKASVAQPKMVSCWSVAFDHIWFQPGLKPLNAVIHQTQGATIFLGNVAQHWVEPSWSAASRRQILQSECGVRFP